MSHNVLTHSGKIISSTASRIKVEIYRDSACGSCTEKSSCAMSESGAVVVELKNDRNYQEGDIVLIEIRKKEFYRSLMLAYVNPLILMTATALITDRISGSELFTAVLTILSLVVYFPALRLFLKNRNSLSYSIQRKL